MQKHPGQMRPRQFVPPLFAGTLLLALGLAPFTAIGRWGIALAAGCYAAGNLAASALTARRRDWRLLPLLAVTFAIIHLSYGLSFLAGLVKFWNRWADRGQWKTLASRPGHEESIDTR